MTANALSIQRDAIADAPAVESPYSPETIVGGTDAIELLAPEWNALCGEGDGNEPFFRAEWFRAFVRNYENEVRLITVRRGRKLIAVLPLVLKKEKLHGVPVTKLAAIFNLQSQRFDLIHTADESQKNPILKALWSEIKRQNDWTVFETRLTYTNSWLADLLEIAKTEDYRTGIWEMDDAPFVTLPTGDNKNKLIDDYFKGLSKNRRKLLSKNLRHLEELGKVEFVVTRGYSKDLIERYFALEAQSWKARAGTDVTSDNRIARLHDDFARECGAKDALFIHELKLDGRTIAMYLSIGFDPKRTVGWKMSFDEKFARFSPGNVLFKEVLSECMRQGSTELDMLSPSNYNKKLFASGTREHAAFYVFQRSFAGEFFYRWKFGVAKFVRDRKAHRSAEAESTK